MKRKQIRKQRLVWITLLLALAAVLLAPVVARPVSVSVNDPDKVAVNWNSRLPAPTPTPITPDHNIHESKAEQ
jgi:hypothetical protein